MYYPRLGELRNDNDMAQKHVAVYLGIDQRVYSTYETGKREMPAKLFVALSKLYGTSTDYIFGLTNSPAPYPKGTKNSAQGQ